MYEMLIDEIVNRLDSKKYRVLSSIKCILFSLILCVI